MSSPKNKTKRIWTEEQKRKISEGVKRAYAEGRLTPPTSKPGVGAKSAKTRKERGYKHNDEILQKISKSIRAKVDAGKWHGWREEDRIKGSQSLKGKRRSDETRTKISVGVKASWEEGKYSNRPKRDIWCSPIEDLIIDELLELGFDYQKAFAVPDQWKNTPNTRYYRPDFVHEHAKVIVELDGSDHTWSDTVKKRDKIRTGFFESRGFKFLRFKNEEVELDKEAVLTKIKALM